MASRILIVAPAPPPYGGMALQAQKLESFLKRDGNEVTFLPTNLSFPGWIRLIERIPVFRTLVRTLLFVSKMWQFAGQSEVIHIFAASWVFFFVAVYPAVVIGRLRGKRTILNYRGGEARAFFRKFSLIASLPFHLASVVTTPSKFLQEVIDDFFQIRTRIVPNLIDTLAFNFRQRQSFHPRLVVSRHLEAIYDIETVLKAFRAIKAHYPAAELLIVGSGRERERLEKLVAEWELNNVQFLGKLDHRELAAVYDRCDIMLNASRVDNFPGSLVEAAAAGLVIVSTNPGGIPYIFENERNALLVSVGDSEALAASVERVIASPELGLEITKQARRMAEQLDWSHVRTQVYQSYGFAERPERDLCKPNKNNSTIVTSMNASEGA